MKKNQDWNTVDGYMKCRYGNIEGGIIQDKALWVTDTPEGLSWGRVLIIDDTCYVYNDTRAIYSIQWKTGDINWSCSLPKDCFPPIKNICGTNDYIIVNTHIIKTDSGEFCADLRDYAGGLQIYEGEGVYIFGSYVYKTIDSVEYPGLILVFNLETRESEVIDIGMIGIPVTSDLFIGWKPEGDIDSLAKYSRNNDSLKVMYKDIGSGAALTNKNQILHITEYEIHLFDFIEERTIWKRKSNSISDSIKPSNMTSYTISMCDETIVIYDYEKVSVLNKETGETLWISEKTMSTPHYQPGHGDFPCIVGDLIYGHHGVLQGELRNMYALDKFTGEMVWSNDVDAMWTAVAARDNKVLYIGLNGQLACYEWDTPYTSPTRLK